MKEIINLECCNEKTLEYSEIFNQAFSENIWIHLFPKHGNKISIPLELLPKGPGIIISTGGSTGGNHLCLHPSTHLDQSAEATGAWLKEEGIDPKKCLIFNSLPFNHVSGLMLWWRSRVWGAKHIWLQSKSMKRPKDLLDLSNKNQEDEGCRLITSLVPTQITRLINNPIGIKWLKSFSIIWVGGSNLSLELANAARKLNIKLAPCYGTTETTAMISVLRPYEFLQGYADCGNPLKDVEISLDKDNNLKIKTNRLTKYLWKNGSFIDIKDENGWWRSGDVAEIISENDIERLKIIGRRDTAISSGGETVFPEILENKLKIAAREKNIKVNDIYFLPIKDKEWGNRMIALIRWGEEIQKDRSERLLNSLREILNDWQPQERPIELYECNSLSKNKLGKWNRSEWIKWLELKVLT